MLGNYPVHPTLPATDFERAKKFYGETLGLEQVSELPAGVFYRAGSTRFLVYPSQGTASGSHTQLGWVVDDIEAEVADLKARGVTFLEYDTPYLKTVNGIATRPNVKSAWFNDTEGNLLGVVQFL